MALAFRDNLSQQNAEDALSKSDTNFRILAELTDSALFIFQGMRFKYVNPAIEHLTGYSRQELLEMKFNDLFPENDKKRMRTWGMQVQRGETLSSRGEFRIITKSGEERWINLIATTIDFDKKKAAIGTAFDITEHKRADVLQEAVYRIAQAVDRSKGLNDLFSAVHVIIAEVMNAENFYIALFDNDRNLLCFPYFVDEEDIPPQPSKPGKGLTEYVLRTGKSLLVDLAFHDDLCKRGEIEPVGVPSPIWLGVPVIIDNEVIGAMVVQHYSNPQVYGDREKCILEFVSSQVAMAINRKRSEDAMRESEERYHRRADELAALYETARDLATQRDLKTLLNTVAERVTALLRSPGCTIYLFNEERRDLEAVVSRGLPGMVGVRLELGEGIAGKVAQTLQPMVIDDHRKWTDRSPKFADLKTIAVAEVPMVYSGELIGVLTVYEIDRGENSQKRKYTQADVDLLTMFAGTAAVAVYNQREGISPQLAAQTMV